MHTDTPSQTPEAERPSPSPLHKRQYEKPAVLDQGPVVGATHVNNDTAVIPDRGSS